MIILILLIWIYFFINCYNPNEKDKKLVKIIQSILRVAICVLFVYTVYSNITSSTSFYRGTYNFTIRGLISELVYVLEMVFIYSFPAIVMNININTNRKIKNYFKTGELNTIEKINLVVSILSIICFAVLFLSNSNSNVDYYILMACICITVIVAIINSIICNIKIKKIVKK